MSAIATVIAVVVGLFLTVVTAVMMYFTFVLSGRQELAVVPDTGDARSPGSDDGEPAGPS